MFKVGLFGGSFDPPTLAHLHIAESLIEKGILDAVEYVPAYVSYHHKSYVATPQERIEMLEKLISYSEYEQSLYVNNFEIRNQMQSSTYDFLKKYLDYVDGDYTYCRYNIDNRDDVEYYFIVGMDNGLKIPRFRNGKKLMDLIPFIVLDRGNIKCVTNRECQGPCPDDCSEMDMWFKHEPHQYVNDINIMDASSTRTRNELGQMFHSGLSAEFFKMCDIDVFTFIMSHGLYGVCRG